MPAPLTSTLPVDSGAGSGAGELRVRHPSPAGADPAADRRKTAPTIEEIRAERFMGIFLVELRAPLARDSAGGAACVLAAKPAYRHPSRRSIDRRATCANDSPLDDTGALQLIRTLDETLEVDVEGHEDDVLMPFFEAAKCDQWPRLLIIEDNRPSPLRVLSVLDDHGYIEILRTKANVTLALPKDGKELGP